MNKVIFTEESERLEQVKANIQASIGVMYKNGIGTDGGEGIEAIKYDYKEMFRLFTEAANQGHAGAQNNLGIMYKEGLSVPHNDYEAFKWFAKAADQGHAEAQNNLGVIYRDGKETPEVVYMVLDDIERQEKEPTAQEYKTLLSDYNLEYPENLDFMNIGKILSEKKGIDYDKAIDSFTKAVANGNDDARVNLKNMLNN